MRRRRAKRRLAKPQRSPRRARPTSNLALCASWRGNKQGFPSPVSLRSPASIRGSLLIPLRNDLAKHTDFTFLVAMDRQSGHCLVMDRFNHLDPASPTATQGKLADLSAVTS